LVALAIILISRYMRYFIKQGIYFVYALILKRLKQVSISLLRYKKQEVPIICLRDT